MTASEPVGGGGEIGACPRHNDVRRAVCRTRNACRLRLCAYDERMRCIADLLVRILHPAVHALHEIERGRCRIDLRRVNPCAVLLALLRVVGCIAEAFVHGIGKVYDTAKIVPVARTEIAVSERTEENGRDTDIDEHGDHPDADAAQHPCPLCPRHCPQAFGGRRCFGRNSGGGDLPSHRGVLLSAPVLEKEGERSIRSLVLLVRRLVADGGIRIAPDRGYHLRSLVTKAVALRNLFPRRCGKTARQPAVRNGQPFAIIALTRNETVLCPYIVRCFLLVADLLGDDVGLPLDCHAHPTAELHARTSSRCIYQ